MFYPSCFHFNMLKRSSFGLHKNRQLQPIEILDLMDKQTSLVFDKLSVMPKEGFSLFHQTLTYWTSITPYFTLEILQKESSEQYILLEQVVEYKDEIIAKLTKIICQLLEDTDNPEISFNAYNAVCQITVDFVRDLGDQSVIHDICKFLQLEVISQNIELLFSAVQCIKNSIKFITFNDQNYLSIIEFLFPLIQKQNDVQQFLLSDIIAFTIRRGYVTDFSQFSQQYEILLVKITILSIKRPNGSLHSNWKVFIAMLIQQSEKNIQSIFLHFVVNSGFETEALYLIISFIIEKYGESNDKLYSTFLTVLQYTELDSNILKLSYFQQTIEIQAFCYKNLLKSQFALISKSLLSEIITNFEFSQQFFELTWSHMNILKQSYKNKLFAQILAEAQEQNKYQMIIISAFYLKQQIDQEIINLIVQDIQSSENYKILETVLFATQTFQISNSNIQDLKQNTITESLNFDNTISFFSTVLQIEDPTQFAIASQILENNLTNNADISEILHLLEDQNLLQIVISKLTSLNSRIRAKMINIVNKLFQNKVFLMFQQIFTTQNMQYFNEIVVQIQISLKQKEFNDIQFQILVGIVYGFIFQRNGLIQENLSKVFQILYAYNKNLIIQTLSLTKLPELIFSRSSQYENINLDQFSIEADQCAHIKVYKESFDERIVTHISKEKASIIALNIENLITLDSLIQTSFTTKAKTNQFILFSQNYQKFGIKYISQLQINNYLSLDIQQVRTNIIQSFWQPSTKFLLTVPFIIITDEISHISSQLLDDQQIDIHRLQYLLYLIIANYQTIKTNPEIESFTAFIAQFAAVEPVLPEIIYIFALFSGISNVFSLARIVNLQTCGDQLPQLFFNDVESDVSVQQIGCGKQDFNEFYKICTVMQKGELSFDYGGKVVVNRNNIQQYKKILLSLLVSRATRSTRSQGINGVGQACVGKVGKEYVRKRRVQQFVLEKLGKDDQHVFFNGQLLAIFKNMFDTLDLYGFILEGNQEELVKFIEKISIRKIHSFLRTYSSIRQATLSLSVDYCLLKLLSSILYYCEQNYMKTDDSLLNNSLKECINFSVNAIVNVIQSTIFEDNDDKNVKITKEYLDLNLLNSVIIHLIDYHNKLAVQELFQRLVINYEYLQQLITFNIKFNIPLINNYMDTQDQIFQLFTYFQIDDVVQQQLSNKVYSEIKKQEKLSLTQIITIFKLINLLKFDKQYIIFAFQVQKIWKDESLEQIALQFIQSNLIEDIIEICSNYIKVDQFYALIFESYYMSTKNDIYQIYHQLLSICKDIDIQLLQKYILQDQVLQQIFFQYCLNINLFQNHLIASVFESSKQVDFHQNLVQFIGKSLRNNISNSKILTNCIILVKFVNLEFITYDDIKIGWHLLLKLNLSSEKQLNNFIDASINYMSQTNQLLATGYYGSFLMKDIIIQFIINFIYQNNISKLSNLNRFIKFVALSSGIQQYFDLLKHISAVLNQKPSKSLQQLLLVFVQNFRFASDDLTKNDKVSELSKYYYNYTIQQLYEYVNSIVNNLIQLLGFQSAQTNLFQIISSGNYNLNIFECYIKILSSIPHQQTYQQQSQILSLVMKNVVQKDITVRKHAVNSLQIIIGYFGINALESSINLLIQHFINDVFKVFYMTNTIYSMVKQICQYPINIHELALLDKQDIKILQQFISQFSGKEEKTISKQFIIRNILTNKVIQLILQAIDINLFSSAQSLLQSDLFTRFVHEDNVYKLIQILISTVTYTNNQGFLLQKIILPLILKAINVKNIYNKLLDAIILGLQNNTSIGTGEIIDIVNYLNDESQCKYCMQKPKTIQSHRNKQEEILNRTDISIQQKTVLSRNAHQLLDDQCLKTKRYDQHSQNQISYDVNMCVYISVSLIYSQLSEINYVISDSQNNNVLKFLKCDIVQPYQDRIDITQDFYTQDSIQFILSILDLAIYSNSDKVLDVVYQIISKLQQHCPELKLSNQFITQSISQLNFITDFNTQKIIYEFVLSYVLKLSNLSEQIQDQLLKTAIIQSKVQENLLVEPFQVINFYMINKIDIFSVQLIEVSEFYLNFSIFKLSNQRNSKIRDIISVIVYNYICYIHSKGDKIQNKFKSLLKLAVEAENTDAKLMSLNILKMMTQNLIFQQLFSDQMIAFVAMMQAATGVQSDDLKQCITETFILALETTIDLSIFNQMFQVKAKFYSALCELFWRGLSIQQIQIIHDNQLVISVLQKDNFTSIHQSISNFVLQRQEIVKQQLLDGSSYSKSASIMLQQFLNADIDYLSLIQTDSNSVQESVLSYMATKKILDYNFIEILISQNIGNVSIYFKSITLQCDDLAKLIQKIGELQEFNKLDSLVSSFNTLRQNDENKVLEFGYLYFQQINKLSDTFKEQGLEALKTIIDANEIYEYLLGMTQE